MKKLKLITLLIIIMVSTLLFSYYNTVKIDNYVEYGTLDLHNTQIDKHGILSLNGSWEFYSGRLLYPEDFKNITDLTPTFMNVPKKWTSLESGGRGCGTYRMIISNTTPNTQYGIIKKNIRIASRIYVDGKLIMEDGYPSNTDSSEIVGNSSKILSFQSAKNSTEIIIQVSNYKYYSGGIIESLRFGQLEKVIQEYRQNISFESIIFAMVISIGLMHGVLVMFIPRIRENSFALRLLPISVITFAIINGALSERVIKLVFPYISSELLIRIEYVAVSLLIMSLFAFIHLLENVLLPKLPHIIIQGIYTVFIIAILIIPMQNNQFWTIFTYFTTVIVVFGFVRVLVFYIIRNKYNISVVEHTIILLLLFIVNVYNLDVYMFTFKNMSNMNIALISTVFYALLWFSWMAYQYRVEFLKNEKLSQELLTVNKSLESEVHLRTEDLEVAIDQLSRANKLLSIKSCEMERLANTDTLTGLNNRLKLDEAFTREISMFERYSHIFSIILIDLDSFKTVNDNYGHQVGDLVLKECAKLLESNIRKVDIIGRWGGEEFMVICPSTELSGAKTLAELLRTKVEEKLFGGKYKITISLGVASFDSSDGMESIFRRVDKSLYHAKSNGKNRVGEAY